MKHELRSFLRKSANDIALNRPVDCKILFFYTNEEDGYQTHSFEFLMLHIVHDNLAIVYNMWSSHLLMLRFSARLIYMNYIYTIGPWLLYTQ